VYDRRGAYDCRRINATEVQSLQPNRPPSNEEIRRSVQRTGKVQTVYVTQINKAASEQFMMRRLGTLFGKLPLGSPSIAAVRFNYDHKNTPPGKYAPFTGDAYFQMATPLLAKIMIGVLDRRTDFDYYNYKERRVMTAQESNNEIEARSQGWNSAGRARAYPNCDVVIAPLPQFANYEPRIKDMDALIEEDERRGRN